MKEILIQKIYDIFVKIALQLNKDNKQISDIISLNNNHILYKQRRKYHNYFNTIQLRIYTTFNHQSSCLNEPNILFNIKHTNIFERRYVVPFNNIKPFLKENFSLLQLQYLLIDLKKTMNNKELSSIKEKLFNQIKYYIKKYELCYIAFTDKNDLHNIPKDSPLYTSFIIEMSGLIPKIKTFPLSDLIFLKNQIKNDALKNKTKTNK